MEHIYISYSHKDREYVLQLQAALQGNGFEAWVDDRVGDEIRPSHASQTRLETCDSFIIVVSENSIASGLAQNEAAQARSRNLPLFPILISGDPWLAVDATLYTNLTGGSLPDEKFYRRLAEAAAQVVSESSELKTHDETNAKPEKESPPSKIVIAIVAIAALMAVGIYIAVIFWMFKPNPSPSVSYYPPQMYMIPYTTRMPAPPRPPLSQSNSSTQIAATQTVSAALTKAAEAQGTQGNYMERETFTSTSTAPAMPTLSPSGEELLLDKAYSCKQQPNAESANVVILTTGIKLPILARSADGWWLVDVKLSFSENDACWIEGGILEGNIENIPVLAP